MKKSLLVPKNPFYAKLKSAGISHLAAAYHISIPHGTLTKYLSGYFPMPSDVEMRLEVLLKKHGGQIHG